MTKKIVKGYVRKSDIGTRESLVLIIDNQLAKGIYGKDICKAELHYEVKEK